jgi:hypothetical protein
MPGGVLVIGALLLAGTGAAWATPPNPPQITEPATNGQLVHAGDVHMESSGFSDPDPGDTHDCNEWQITVAGTGEVAWRSNGCETPPQRDHIHMGDGVFVNSHGNRNELFHDADYVVRVRARDNNGEFSQWAERAIHTYPQGPAGTPGAIPWVGTEPGFAVELVAGGFQLPTHLDFSENGSLLYVGELYGTVKVIRPGGSVSVLRNDLLNFNPTGDFPGSGEFGVGGIEVQPGSGDVFYTTVYESPPSSGTFYGRVGVIWTSNGGLTGAAPQTVLDLGPTGPGPAQTQAPSHQISNITLGPDGKLYVHHGDSFVPSDAQNINSFRGKVLRLNVDGSAPINNPLYDGAPFTARDFVWAAGFRNPFGGDWRSSNNAHYEVENGPQMDRFARVGAGQNFGWDGGNGSMATLALYNWITPHAPVHVAFVEPQTFGGSGFPPHKQDHAFVTESGPTYASGPQQDGKRITEFAPNPGTGEMSGPPTTLAVYTGNGQATAAGLAAGPDGLYFTELYQDQNSSSPIDPGARVFRIRYFPPIAECTLNGRSLEISAAAGDPVTISRGAGRQIIVDGHWCGATVDNIDGIRIRGGDGDQEVRIDLSGGGFAPGASFEPGTDPEIEFSVDLGGGTGDRLTVVGGPGDDAVEFTDTTVRLNTVGDLDVGTAGVELRDFFGNDGNDLALGDAGASRFDGGSGDDLLEGRAGKDRLIGGKGRDRLLGGAGKDRLAGGKGRDKLVGGAGKDRLIGGKGRDKLLGGSGKDRCSGGKDRLKSC